MALWRHGGGAWHNGLILMTASNANSWADIANHVTWLWPADDTENFEHQWPLLLTWFNFNPSMDK